MNIIEIREALKKDENCVAELVKKFQSSPAFDTKIFSSIWSEKITDPNSYIGVAVINGLIIGYVSGYIHSAFYANGLVFWVDEIFVKEETRKVGVGSMLMNSVEIWVGERNCNLIALATNGAKQFYPQFGFEETAGYFKKYI